MHTSRHPDRSGILFQKIEFLYPFILCMLFSRCMNLLAMQANTSRTLTLAVYFFKKLNFYILPSFVCFFYFFKKLNFYILSSFVCFFLLFQKIEFLYHLILCMLFFYFFILLDTLTVAVYFLKN